MDKLNIVKNITKEITGKKIQKSDNDFYQSVDIINYSHWTDLLHELCHWIVADNQQRKADNLGMPSVYDKYSGDFKIIQQEVLASYLTYKFGMYLANESKEVDYLNYIKDKDNGKENKTYQKYLTIRKRKLIKKVENLFKRYGK
jgi:elongation factor P hydroxylase